MCGMNSCRICRCRWSFSAASSRTFARSIGCRSSGHFRRAPTRCRATTPSAPAPPARVEAAPRPWPRCRCRRPRWRRSAPVEPQRPATHPSSSRTWLPGRTKLWGFPYPIPAMAAPKHSGRREDWTPLRELALTILKVRWQLTSASCQFAPIWNAVSRTASPSSASRRRTWPDGSRARPMLLLRRSRSSVLPLRERGMVCLLPKFVRQIMLLRFCRGRGFLCHQRGFTSNRIDLQRMP
mmetsp:Transcript_84167/g.241940  ORF Transcript_84167/g.241940 Transcript_84167/m.241940 type:complete len:238 (+) Transcript_84167:502-1215(+)